MSGHPLQMPEAEWLAYCAERGVAPDVPAGARALGCRNCRIGDRLQHPELGQRIYCASCPVTYRQRARAAARSAPPPEGEKP